MPASPETIALYITDLASRPLAVATIVRRLTAISKAHAAAGFPSPASTRNLVVGDTLRGIKRTLGTAPHRKDALLAADIRRLIAACSKNLLGLRDKALFLISFAGAFRRSESAGLNVEDLNYCREGLVCRLRRSKTDQEGGDRKVGIPFGKDKTTCPVCALKRWLKKGSCQNMFSLDLGRQGLRSIIADVAIDHARAFIHPQLIAAFRLLVLSAVDHNEVGPYPPVSADHGGITAPAVFGLAEPDESDLPIGHPYSPPIPQTDKNIAIYLTKTLQSVTLQ
jgi:hypothetical protein